MCTAMDLDPYEEQLYQVFASHDRHQNGSLDKQGLEQLCETLQLQDKSDDLIASLLKAGGRNGRATFAQFKDALLQLLGTMQSTRGELHDEPHKEKDDREVAPKYVVGSKKYGRRSRPRIDDATSPIGPGIQRSNSTAEHIRKPLRLQRCTSVPSVPSSYDETSFISSSMSELCTEDMLREAWRKLGVGEDGYLNQEELILVFEAIGLDKLTENVIRNLSNNSVMDYSKISFQELLEALQKDDTWSEFLCGGEHRLALSVNPKENFILNSDEVHHSKVVQNIKLGPEGSGFVSQEAIVEMWENAGIASPLLLLKDLGFKQTGSINVQELAVILEKEIKSLSELRIDHTCNPLVALLQAFITIYQAEIKCLKSILQQMCDEKEKLKFDLSEANNRSTLLAQEVDESVAKIEQKTQLQVKQLEHRHAEIIKELAEQNASEKEQVQLNNTALESKIKTLENEESALRDSLLTVQTYVGVVEGENKDLTNRVYELEAVKDSLEKHIDELEVEKLRALEADSMKSDELMETIGVLQRENGVLKDKNDEMISQIEALNREMQAMSVKAKNCEDDTAALLVNIEGIGVGGKRRSNDSDEPAGVDELDFDCAITESPRLGKMRKYHECKDSALDTSLTLSERSSGGDGDNDADDADIDVEVEVDDASSNPPRHRHRQHRRRQRTQHDALHRKTMLVRSMLGKYGIELDMSENSQETQSNSYTHMLELLLRHLLMTTINEDKTTIKLATELAHNHPILLTKGTTTTPLVTEVPTLADNEYTSKIQQLEQANKTLTDKCDDLQQGLNLLRDEYELCEDYWQKKLEEERNIYEMEQAQSTDKLNEVLTRLTEYEEQFLDESKRLTIIDETQLEKQYTDLEHEYDDFRERAQLELDDKELLIGSLQEQLDRSLVRTSKVQDVGVQVADLKCLMNLSNHLIENTNLYPHDTEAPPIQWPKMYNNLRVLPLPTTSQEAPHEATVMMPLKTKKNRRHVRALTQPARNVRRITDSPSDSSDSNPPSPKARSEMQQLEAKYAQLDKKCKELQGELKNQKKIYEQLSKSYCRLYHSCRGELQHAHAQLDQQFRVSTKLQEKLQENDMLVGNLYIENAYLMKNNQRLEQQLNMFAATQQMNVNMNF